MEESETGTIGDLITAESNVSADSRLGELLNARLKVIGFEELTDEEFALLRDMIGINIAPSRTSPTAMQLRQLDQRSRLLAYGNIPQTIPISPATKEPASQEGASPEFKGEEVSIFTYEGTKGEDRFIVRDVETPKSKGRLFAVFDGHRGEVVSAGLGAEFAEMFNMNLNASNGNAEEALRNTIRYFALRYVDEESGSTVSAVYIPEGSRAAYAAALGDSPIVWRNGDGSVGISPQHNMHNIEERERAKRLFEEEGREVSLAEGGMIVKTGGEEISISYDAITRTIGDRDYALGIPEPDVFEIPFENVRTLILASDGLFVAGPRLDLLEADAAYLLHLAEEGQPARALVDDAISRGSIDDITAIVIAKKESPEGASPEWVPGTEADPFTQMVQGVFAERGYEIIGNSPVGGGSRAFVYKARGLDDRIFAIKIANPEEGFSYSDYMDGRRVYWANHGVFNHSFSAIVQLYSAGIISVEELWPHAPHDLDESMTGSLDRFLQSRTGGLHYQILEFFDGRRLTELFEEEFFEGKDINRLLESLVDFISGINEIHNNELSHGELGIHLVHSGVGIRRPGHNVAMDENMQLKAHDIDTMRFVDVGDERDRKDLQNIAFTLLTQVGRNTPHKPKIDAFFEEWPESAVAVRGLLAFVEGLNQLKAEIATPPSKDLGGTGATKESADTTIKDLIQAEDGTVVKLRLSDDKYYMPRFIENYQGTPDEDFDPRNVLENKVLTPIQLQRLKRYLARAGIDPDTVTIGIVRGRALINPTDDESFTIVHVGEHTRTVWFGELLLQDILDDEEDDEAQPIFNHDVKHITSPEEAEKEHADPASGYKDLVKRVKERCDELDTAAQNRRVVVHGLMEESGLGTGLAVGERSAIEERLAQWYFTAIVTESELRHLLKDFKLSKRPLSELEDFLQNEILDYFLVHYGGILREVKDGAPLEKKKVHELFMAGIRVYRFPLTMHLIEKRKELLTYFILLNIHPPGSNLGSPIRSKEARKLMIGDVFASENESISQPGLEVIIELFAEGKGRDNDHFFRAFYPLLKESEKLPHFGKLLIDVLIKAEHHGTKLFEIKSKEEFFEEAKKIIVRLASESPSLRDELTRHIDAVAGERDEEISLAQELRRRVESAITQEGASPEWVPGSLEADRRAIFTTLARETHHAMLAEAGKMDDGPLCFDYAFHLKGLLKERYSIPSHVKKVYIMLPDGEWDVHYWVETEDGWRIDPNAKGNPLSFFAGVLLGYEWIIMSPKDTDVSPYYPEGVTTSVNPRVDVQQQDKIKVMIPPELSELTDGETTVELNAGGIADVIRGLIERFPRMKEVISEQPERLIVKDDFRMSIDAHPPLYAVAADYPVSIHRELAIAPAVKADLFTETIRFSQNLRALAEEAKNNGEELVVGIDTDIGNLGKYAGELFKVLEGLQGRDGFENLRIIPGEGKSLGARLNAYLAEAKGGKKKVRAIAIAKKKNVERDLFNSLGDDVQVVSVDDVPVMNESGQALLCHISTVQITEIIRRALNNGGSLEYILDVKDDPRRFPESELEDRYREAARYLRNA